MAGPGLLPAIRTAFTIVSVLSALFSRRQAAPRTVQDLPLQTVQRGTPLPIVHGTRRLAGNVVWVAPPQQYHVGGGKGGKGGGQGKGSDQIGYKLTYAVAICEGPANILQVWSDKEMLDLSKVGSVFTFYKGVGTSTQDPTIASYYGGSQGTQQNAQFVESAVINGASQTYVSKNKPIVSGTDQVYYLTETGDNRTVMNVVLLTRVTGTPVLGQYSVDLGSGTFTVGGTYANQTIWFAYNTQVGATSAVFSNAPAFPYTCYAVVKGWDSGRTTRLPNLSFEVSRNSSAIQDLTTGQISVAWSSLGVGGAVTYQSANPPVAPAALAFTVNVGIAVQPGDIIVVMLRGAVISALASGTAQSWVLPAGWQPVTATAITDGTNGVPFGTAYYLVTAAATNPSYQFQFAPGYTATPSSGLSVYAIVYRTTIGGTGMLVVKSTGSQTTTSTSLSAATPNPSLSLVQGAAFWTNTGTAVSLNFDAGTVSDLFDQGSNPENSTRMGHTIGASEVFSLSTQVSLFGMAESQIVVQWAIPSWASPPVQPAAQVDANPADIVYLLLTGIRDGAGRPTSDVDTAGTFLTAWYYYYQNGIGLSPIFDNRKNAFQHLEEIMVLTDSLLGYSQGLIKLIPRGAAQTPYAITTASYTTDQGVEVGRVGVSDLVSRVVLRHSRRDDWYTVSQQEAHNDWMIGRSEGVDMDIEGQAITNANLARQVATRIHWTRAFNRLTAKIPLGPQDQVVEWGDVISWTDADLGLSARLMRVMEVSQDLSQRLVLDCVEENQAILGWSTAPAPGQSSVSAIVAPQPTAHTLLSVQEGYPETVNYNPTVMVAMSSVEKTWAGAALYLSDDNVTYAKVATARQPAIYGYLGTSLAAPPTSSPQFDTVNTLQVTLLTPGATFVSVTENQWRLGANRILVDNEVIYFQTATLVSGSTWNLTGLIRGMEGTSGVSHLANAGALVLNGYVFLVTPGGSIVNPSALVGLQPTKSVPVPWVLTGRTIYFKAASIDLNGNVQALSAVQPVTLTYGGTGGMPETPGLFTAKNTVDSPNWTYGTADQAVRVSPTPNRSLTVVWTYQSAMIDEDGELENGVPSGYDPYFDHYRVSVVVSGTTVRIEDNLTTESYVYTEAKNLADNGSFAATVTIQVQTVNHDGGISPAAQQTFTMWT